MFRLFDSSLSLNASAAVYRKRSDVDKGIFVCWNALRCIYVECFSISSRMVEQNKGFWYGRTCIRNSKYFYVAFLCFSLSLSSSFSASFYSPHTPSPSFSCFSPSFFLSNLQLIVLFLAFRMLSKHGIHSFNRSSWDSVCIIHYTKHWPWAWTYSYQQLRRNMRVCACVCIEMRAENPQNKAKEWKKEKKIISSEVEVFTKESH